MWDARWWPPLLLHGAAFAAWLAGAAVWLVAQGSAGTGAPYELSDAPAWRQPGGPVALPGGSWIGTAQDVTLKGNRLCARLRRDPGGPWSSDCVAVQEGQRFRNVGGSFQPERPTRFPGGTWMLTAQRPRLEGNLFFATLRRRNLTWAEAHAVVWDGVYFENEDGVLKLLMQSCERLACLHGYVLRFNSTYIYCEYLECRPHIDTDTCCEPAMPCENLTTCPPRTFPDPGGYCLAATCNEDRDRAHCCQSAAFCSDLPRCVVSYTHLPGGGDNRCPRFACDPVLDRDTCCTPAAPCTNMTDYSCPNSFYFNMSWWCDGVVCEAERDRDVCCMPAAPCFNATADICTYGYADKINLTDHYCNGYQCDPVRDKAFCCDPADPCSSLTCPHGFTLLPDTFCSLTRCDPAVDTAHCCHAKAPCTDLVGRQCPYGHFFNTTDFCSDLTCNETWDRRVCCQVASPCTALSCPFSYIQKVDAASLFCEGTACDLARDLDICCDQAEPCWNMTCPRGFTKRGNITELFCLGTSCKLPRDRDVCCEDAAFCAVHFVCPHGYTPRNGTYCDGPTCEVGRDRDNCCDSAMPCTNITCPWNHIHTPDRYCPATTCVYLRDVDYCCELGVPMRFVRFVPTQLREITSDDVLRPVVQVAEFTPRFHGKRTALDVAVAYAVNGSYPSHESPQEAIDNNLGTKWLDFQSTPFTIRYPTLEKINTITLTTANDMPSRDPVGWRVLGSMDGVTYVLIHEIVDAFTAVPTTRFADTQAFGIYIPCLPPRADIANGKNYTCLEGTLIGSNETCTPVCSAGYLPSEEHLNCTDGRLDPNTYQCL